MTGCLYTKLEDEQKANFVAKDGYFIICYYQGTKEDFRNQYNEILNFAYENNLEIEKTIFIERILDEFSYKVINDNVFRICIKANEKQS